MYNIEDKVDVPQIISFDQPIPFLVYILRNLKGILMRWSACLWSLVFNSEESKHIFGVTVISEYTGKFMQ